MKACYVIEARLFGDDGILSGGAEFMAKFSPFRREPTTTYAIDDEKILAQATQFLSHYKLEYTLFCTPEIIAEELKDYPAIYFGISSADELFIEEYVNPLQFSNLDIACDYQTDKIVVSSHFVETIKKLVRNVHWQTAPGTNGELWTVMDIVERLPDPIQVPFPVEILKDEAPAITASVLNDGRTIITKHNIEKLQDVGIALCTRLRLPELELSTKPILVASGRVIFELKSAGIQGLTEPPVPLLPEGHPLTVWHP